MTEPQNWVLIGIFVTVMLGGMTLMTTLINRTTTVAIEGLRGEMNGRFDGVRGEMNGRFEGVRGEMNGLHGDITGLRSEMNARFETIEHQIAHLDRDVTALVRRAIDE